MKKIVKKIMSLLIICGMVFCFTPVQKANAENMMVIVEPVKTESYIAGIEVPIVLSPQMFNIAQYDSYAQVEVLKNGKRVFFENILYYGSDDITPAKAFIPTKAGTYTIKAGMVFTNDTPPDEIYKLQQTSTFKVVSASSIKKMTPDISSDRDDKGQAVLTCTNNLGGKVKMKVYRAEKKNGKYELVDTVSSNTFTDTKAIALKTYYYKVKWSLKNDGKTYTSKFSAINSCSPSRPQIECERTSKGKVKVSCVNKPDGVKMEVYRATSKSGKYKLVKTTKKASFTDSQTKAKKVYYYKVRLTQKSGKKTYKSKYSPIVKADKTGGSGSLVAKAINTSKGVKITWNKYSKAGFYLISRSTSSNAEGDVIGCYGDNEFEAYDTEAEKGKTYYYTVSAWYGNDEKPLIKSKPVKLVVK